ncbi:probable BOI-related E3 ubiquitin-protein ligase 2 [Phragmites australis]|uniref:probable BOI-related E3 ubiquitin-protein ligase 2 n=1 Tax=Phragmites australis TaxID=29695 RepID=UPI002D79DF74|nr:probable BOI-related E3 ubiquitin-protein ligase 2 [Phragmites australis]
MAVQAQYYAAHAFLHDSRAIRPALDNATSASVFLGETRGGGGHLLASAAQAMGGNTIFSDPHSDLTCNSKNADACLIMEGHGALLPPVPVPQVYAQSRVLCSAAASTSGRPVTASPVSQGLLSHLYRDGVEIDALIRIENERLRAGLEEARRWHVRTVVSAVERAAARRLRDAEAALEHVLMRNVELEEKLRQMSSEGQAWRGIAENHEAVAAGLRATLDQILQSPRAGAGTSAEGEGDADDARSCCFEREESTDDVARTRACKACGGADACVLLLPCRHLCLCSACEAAVDACPVCAATKNASLHVLLS